jgi:lysophospholipase L1-like esterase
MSQATPTADAPRPGRLRRIGKGLGVSLVVVALTLVAAEVLVRLFADLQPRRRVIDPVLGTRYVPGWTGSVYKKEAGREIPLRFNQQGFRFPDLPFEKPAGTRRVAFLGDSMIAGEDVPVELTAVHLLEQQLDALDPDHDWEVLNFGVPGAGNGQEMVVYREVARRYDPDLVLCTFFTGNDFGDNSHRYTSGDRLYFDVDADGALFQLPYPTPEIARSEFLRKTSHFYRWQKSRVRGLIKAAEPEEEVPTDPLEQRHAWHGDKVRSSEWVYYTGLDADEDVAHCWRVTAAILREFDRLTRADGVPFAMLLLPNSEQLHDEEFAFLQSVAGELGPDFDPLHPGRRVGEICAELDVPFLDLLPAFRAATPSRSELVEEEWLYLNGRGHFNAAGHALLARTLVPDVLRLVRVDGEISGPDGPGTASPGPR